jgi:hypothetical protein
MYMHDVIVVGSGCSGAMAAQTLVEGGRHVLMLDVGAQDTTYAPLIPDKDFGTIRKTEVEQYRYLIGDTAEGVTWGTVGKGEQVTAPRKHMLALAEQYLPTDEANFSGVESLGYGGLGIGWGIGCWEFSKPELEAAGLPVARMQAAYNLVRQRIGISATPDQAVDYSLGNLRGYQPSPDMDRNHKLIERHYQSRQSRLYDKGFIMGRAPLALITSDYDGRKGYGYQDMDFYSDKDRSAWRPWITINALKRRSNFTYQNGQFVTSFSEKSDHTIVHCIDTTTHKTTAWRCRRLLLAPGTLGSARIVLRSFRQSGQHLPLLCNPYSYIPCIQPTMLGKEFERHKLGFAQLSLFLDEDHDLFDVSMASLYSYQSLMLFRMVRHVPFNFRDARIITRYLAPALVIMGLHQPDRPSAAKYVELLPDSTSITGDKLRTAYALNSVEVMTRRSREKKYIAALRSLRTYALKSIDPGFGSSIHYAGTIPFNRRDKPYTLSPSGKLHGTKHVYVADSSGFTYLPAKGLTFSLLANAHIIAHNALHDI